MLQTFFKKKKIAVEFWLHPCNTIHDQILVAMSRFAAFSTLRKVVCGHMKKRQMLCVARTVTPHIDPFKIGIQEMQKLLLAQEQPKAMRSGGCPGVKHTAYCWSFRPQIWILLFKAISPFLLYLQEGTAQFSTIIAEPFCFPQPTAFTASFLHFFFFHLQHPDSDIFIKLSEPRQLSSTDYQCSEHLF